MLNPAYFHPVKRILGVILFIFSLTVSPTASAVVSGEYVIDPTSEAPWVVSIWVKTQQNSEAEPNFICSASLYKEQFLLTAAHCFQGIKGIFYAEVGATQLGKGSFIPIDSYWISPRYSRLSIVNDIAVAHLIVPTKITKFPTLATAAKATSNGSNSTVIGWGADQNGEVTGDLRKSSLKFDATTAASKFGAGFNSKTNIAAGRYISKEKIYTAACHGDSGGPLVIGALAKPTIVGVVSYGPAESCNLKIPTVFSRVSYYLPDIKVAENYTMARAISNSLATPYNLEMPSISGSTTENSTLECSKGSWTPNAKSFTYTWYSQSKNGKFSKVSDANSSSIVLKRDYFSKSLWCAVVATSHVGDAEEDVKIDLPNLPEEISITSPIEGTSIGGKFTLSTRVVDATSATSGYSQECLIYLGQDKKEKKYCDYIPTNGNSDWSFDTTNWANGSYTFTFYAIDSSGRQSNTATRVLNISNASPVATFTEPAEGSTIAGQFSLKATAVPSAAGTATISKLCLKINGAKPTSGGIVIGSVYSFAGYADSNGCHTESDQTPEWSFDTSTWANGSYTFTFYAIDSSGRQSNTATRVLRK